MKYSRLFLPLAFAFSLLFAQQAAVTHLISHSISQARQHDKHSSHHTTCEKCASYAQLGNALHVAIHDFTALAIAEEAIRFIAASFPVIHKLAAVARGPPASLQKN